MESASSEPSEKNDDDALPITLLQLLFNDLVLEQTAPYLSASSILALSATSKSFRALILAAPSVFRYLDLTKVSAAQFEIAAIDHGGEVWRNVQLDENVTEEDFYGGPLRGIFNTLKRRDILQHVQTLVLDGLSVTADLVSDIILQEHFNVRILSIREVQNLNERKLQKALEYAVRAGRPPNTPKLKGLYIFGPKDVPPPVRVVNSTTGHTVHSNGVTRTLGAQIGAHWNSKSEDALGETFRAGDKWYQKGGRVLAKRPSTDWDITLFACEGIIHFDAVLCHSPQHPPPLEDPVPRPHQLNGPRLPPRIATHTVAGCACCGSAPEGVSEMGSTSLDRFPLLAPPPLHSSTVEAATGLFIGSESRLLVRCQDCLRARFCENCKKWWCEDCYEIPTQSLPKAWELMSRQSDKNVKVHIGLCIEDCLVEEMMSGAGSNGMWG